VGRGAGLKQQGIGAVKIKEILELVTGYAGSGKAELVQKAYALLTATLPAESSPGPIPPLEKAVEAAGVLADLESRSESVAAALLIDCPEHGCATDLIEEQVGEGVARLVAGVRRMRSSPYLASLDNRSRSNRARSEIYYAFVDALEDPQLVLIGLAHQLSRIRRVGAFPQDEQERIGHEVQLIYAPLADRLGIWRLKWELEDRAFRIIRPEEYHEIAQALNQHRAEREAGIQQMAGTLTTELDKLEIQAEVSGRPKHISSIYRKMQRKGVPFEAIYDVRALRVLTGDIPTCYQVLGVVHRLWTPIPGQLYRDSLMTMWRSQKATVTGLCTQRQPMLKGKRWRCRFVPARCTRRPSWGLLHIGDTKNIRARKRQHARRDWQQREPWTRNSSGYARYSRIPRRAAESGRVSSHTEPRSRPTPAVSLSLRP